MGVCKCVDGVLVGGWVRVHECGRVLAYLFSKPQAGAIFPVCFDFICNII